MILGKDIELTHKLRRTDRHVHCNHLLRSVALLLIDASSLTLSVFLYSQESPHPMNQILPKAKLSLKAQRFIASCKRLHGIVAGFPRLFHRGRFEP